MRQFAFDNVLSYIEIEENKIKLKSVDIIAECFEMVNLLQTVLSSLKNDVVVHGFASVREEVNFFKHLKPQILGKLIYYNRVYFIEISCPTCSSCDGTIRFNYYTNNMQELNKEYIFNISSSEFYRYYRAGRTDRDEIYFTLAHINFYEGLNSLVFELDPLFSTYYDYQTSLIIASDLLFSYIHAKLNPEIQVALIASGATLENEVKWTETKAALTELIYSLYAAGCISNGRIGLRKISQIFEILFNIQLGDLHHSFHRMKVRAGDRTSFLNYLKISLEQYMDKDL